MNIKLRAGLEVGAFILGAVALQVAIIKIGEQFTADQIVTGIGLTAMTFCVYQLYRIRVGQLETDPVIRTLDK